MNQSNKALRDGLRNCFTDSSLDSFMRGATGKSDHSDLHEKYIDRALALVTNHARAAILKHFKELPSMQMGKQHWDEDFAYCRTCEYQPFDDKNCICVFQDQLRHQLLKEMGAE